MRLQDLYIFISKLQEIVGNDCNVSVCVPMDEVLRIDFRWFNPSTNKMIVYTHSRHLAEMTYIKDIDMFMTYLILKAKEEYEVQSAKDLPI